MACLWAGVVASDLGKEHTRCGTWQYWLVVFSILPVILGITFLVSAGLHPFQCCTHVWYAALVYGQAQSLVLAGLHFDLEASDLTWLKSQFPSLLSGDLLHLPLAA